MAEDLRSLRGGRVKSETDRQLDAFIYYYNLGPLRSYNKVAKYIGVSLPSVSNWAKKFEWEQRVAELDEGIGGRVAEFNKRANQKEVAQYKKELNNYRKVVRDTIVEFSKRLKKNKIEIKKPDDLVKLIGADVKIMEFLMAVSEAEETKNMTPDKLVEFYFSDSKEAGGDAK
jgi:transposase